MANLKDIASLANVSKATVSRVINNNPTVSEQVRLKVMDAMKKLQVNAVELRRVTEESKIIGLIQPFNIKSSARSFTFDIMLGAEEKAFDNEYTLLIGDSSSGIEKEHMLAAMMVKRDIDGLIILSRSSPKDDDLKFLEYSGVPLVQVDQRKDDLLTNVVRGDNLSSCMQLMDHLFSLGHRHIGMISRTKYSTYLDRFRGYTIAMMERGYPVTEAFLMRIEKAEQDITPELETFINHDPRPTALIAAIDFLPQVIRFFEEQNINIPSDMSVAVFDEASIALPDKYQNFFTSIDQSGRSIGKMAVELLLQQIKNPEIENQEVILPGKLIVRQSTARVGPVQ